MEYLKNIGKKAMVYGLGVITVFTLYTASLKAADFENGGEKFANGLENAVSIPAEPAGMAGMVAREFAVDRDMGFPGAVAGFGVGAIAGGLRSVGRGFTAVYNVGTCLFSNKGEAVFTGNNLSPKIWNDYEDDHLANQPTTTEESPSKLDELNKLNHLSN